MLHTIFRPTRRPDSAFGQVVTTALLTMALTGCGVEDPYPPGYAVPHAGSAGGSGGSTGTAGVGGGGATGGAGAAGTSGTIGTDAMAPTRSPDTGGSPSAMADYFPLAVGNSWEYIVTEAGAAASRKINRVVRTERVGGDGPSKDVIAARFETLKKSGTGASAANVRDASISWQNREGSQILRYREIACATNSVMLTGDGSAIDSCLTEVEDHWMPPRPRIDEKPMGQELVKGMTWQAPYTEFKVSYNQANPAMPTATRTTNRADDQWQVVDLDVRVTVPAGTFSNCLVLQKRSLTDAIKTYTFCRGVGKVKEVGTGQTEDLAVLPILK